MDLPVIAVISLLSPLGTSNSISNTPDGFITPGGIHTVVKGSLLTLKSRQVLPNICFPPDDLLIELLLPAGNSNLFEIKYRAP